ncbi:MAG: M23 family peptidase [Alphaproteobacteria bacterium]|nr:M23 family peptidase [Alphaproteobacteria bacterium]
MALAGLASVAGFAPGAQATPDFGSHTQEIYGGGAPAAALPSPVERVARIAKGDNFSGALVKAGLDTAEAAEIAKALRPKIDVRKLAVGQEIKLALTPGAGTRQWRLVSLSMSAEGDRTLQLWRRPDGSFGFEDHHKVLHREAVRVAGEIEDGLYAALTETGLPPVLVVEAVRLFAVDLDLERDVQAGDRFEILFERFVDEDGVLARNGDILMAAYLGEETTLRLYRHVVGGKVGYYDAEGRSHERTLLRTPVDGATVNSPFGMRQGGQVARPARTAGKAERPAKGQRKPVRGGYSANHKGVDFGAPVGTPVRAAGDGTIEIAKMWGAYGNYVRIRHPDGYATAYAHLANFRPGLKAGVTVRQGEVIGAVGRTGRTTGPHLHFEVLIGDRQVDPLTVKVTGGAPLAGTEAKLFFALREAIERELAAMADRGPFAAVPATAAPSGVHLR